METKKIIEELELNYGYKFNPKEKHEFDWLCNLISDVETVVSKNESLHDVRCRCDCKELKPRKDLSEPYKCAECGGQVYDN